jgi:hypothetical protein
MKRLDRAEHGMALIWVVSMMTLVLMVLGGLLSLAPVAFRQAFGVRQQRPMAL